MAKPTGWKTSTRYGMTGRVREAHRGRAEAHYIMRALYEAKRAGLTIKVADGQLVFECTDIPHSPQYRRVSFPLENSNTAQ